MSLFGYQQAPSDMVASPQLCLRVRGSAAAPDGYDLTERERSRLAAVAAQRGMSTSCTLYRVNRIAPLHAYLPLTCALLGDQLIREAERFWSEGKPGNRQFGPETQRFGRFLQRRLREGAIADTYLGEVALELAGNALRWGAQPPTHGALRPRPRGASCAPRRRATPRPRRPDRRLRRRRRRLGRPNHDECRGAVGAGQPGPARRSIENGGPRCLRRSS